MSFRLKNVIAIWKLFIWVSFSENRRKYKIDEFPQLINVIKGDMSIVGPRPEVRKYVELYTPDQSLVLTVRPGITGLASLEYVHENKMLGESDNPEETYLKEMMPRKLELNLEYVRSANFRTDLMLILQTFVAFHPDEIKTISWGKRGKPPPFASYLNLHRSSFRILFRYDL